MKLKSGTPIPSQSRARGAILVGVQLPGAKGYPMDLSLEELDGLATTGNYSPVATVTQKLDTIYPKTFLGKGKIEELREAVDLHQPDAVIFDENLSPGQNRNLEKIFGCRVFDRSWLILEIFNDHARTREAKTQVELARLKYALPRLTGMWGHLSRQRGGIGMRDVGETQIQLDRRLIRNEIYKLEKKLKLLDKEKITQRKGRSRLYQVALVGYTNVGKSSLMNLLTEAETLVENKLFATLDPTTRRVKKNFPFPILLSDTVGLINKLPHDLVASFKSTLDEAREADLLIKVNDLSHPNLKNQMVATDKLLSELGVADSDSIAVFNKIDAIEDSSILEDMQRQHPDAVFLSCKEGEGIDDLRAAVVRSYEKSLTALRVELNHAQSGLLHAIQKHAMVVNSDYHADGVTLDLKVDPRERKKLDRVLNASVTLAGEAPGPVKNRNHR